MARNQTQIQNDTINRIYAGLMIGNRYESAADGEKAATAAALYASHLDIVRAASGDDVKTQAFYASLDIIVDMIRHNRPTEEKDFLILRDLASEFALNSQAVQAPGSYSASYSDVHSFQPVDPDLTLGAAAGSADGSNPKYLAAVMGNIFGDALTKTANYLGGVIGAFSITGTKATSYPAGAVLAQITDGVTQADGAVVAYVDGDSGVTTANAAFKAMCNNSNAGSGFDYGMDLHSPSHDGFIALAINKAMTRSPNEVCSLEGSGAPTDGTTGTGFAGKGSMYTDYAAGEAYINTGTKAATVWKQITHA